MLWVKAFHIIFMVSWFAGLFYLPRLFVYHTNCEDDAGKERFKIMERKLLKGIMNPAALLTLATGIWMLVDYAWAAYSDNGWLHAKLMLVVIIIVYHHFCGQFFRAFRDDRNQRSHVFYRWFNELPVLLLVAIVILVVVRPF